MRVVGALGLALLLLSGACGGAVVVSGADAGAGDGGPRDGGPRDGGLADGGPRDGGSADGGSADGGSADGGARDAGAPDAGAADGGLSDGGLGDGGLGDGGVGVCTPGQDQTCNDDPAVSALWGHCEVNGACSCIDGFERNPATGRCWNPSADCEGACGIGCVGPGNLCFSDGQFYCSECRALCHGVHRVSCVDGG